MIGPRIIIPIVLVAIIVPAGYVAFRRYVRSLTPEPDAPVSGSRLTSAALHRHAPPGWRFVFEVPSDALGGVDQVAVGPGGIFALATVVAEMPDADGPPATAEQIADAAIARSDLDDLLGRCAMASDALARVHWGRDAPHLPTCVQIGPGALAVSGHRLDEWLRSLPDDRLRPAQVDLAWRTITTGIGRPDPID